MEFMDWWPYDEGILMVDEEAEDRRVGSLDEDTFTMNPDDGFEEEVIHHEVAYLRNNLY